MKKRIVVILFFVFVCLCGNIQAGPLSISLGATFNPFNYEYTMCTFGLVAFAGDSDYSDDHVFIAEARLSFGSATLRYNAPNVFTMQRETTEYWEKSGIFEVAGNALYQYTINDIVALRFGIGLTTLWSGIFSGVKPGLDGDGTDLTIIGFYGVAGTSIFPRKRFPILIYVSPGVIFDPYQIDDKLFKFILPISVAIGWQFGI